MGKPNEELDDALYAKVLALSEEGNRLIEEDDNLPAALDAYGEALALLPLPIERWDAALWLLIALGDSHFLLGQYDQAYDFLARAMRCPDALGTPFIHLRLGEIQFERGNLDKAADELARAYMGDGPEIFDTEDPKYLTFLRTRMRGI